MVRPLVSLVPLLASAFFVFVSPPARAEPILREPGAFYFSDASEKPFFSPLKYAAISYFDAGESRYAGTLRFPQTVEVLAVREQQAKVRGQAQQGQVAAWIALDAIEGITPELLASLSAAAERSKQIAALIKRNEIAVGMTMEEVRQSLGKPQKTTRRATTEDSDELWEYIHYKYIPQQTVVNTPMGLTTSTVYVKVPDGTIEVTAKNGIVTSIQQSEGTTVQKNSTILVPPVYYSPYQIPYSPGPLCPPSPRRSR